MGFFDQLADSFRSAVGSVDNDLLTTGILGRADLLAVDLSGTTMQFGNGLVERKCTFSLQVYLDGETPYPATCVQRVQEIYIPQLVPGQTALAVRVDPAILENGTDAAVVLVANQPMGLTSSAGDPVQALTLTVDKGAESYQVQVGNGVPNSALPLLFPGSKLHAKIGDGPNDVVVDWAKGARA
ncbi:hypothetical protein GCM10011600_28750 [Pseudolysinimonas yzui]|uniref:Uncharacterized protein n=1 Tax=Pseudolysinimonas yzui TaxID=2708254 RepID=A0A8J3GSK2_9MICO|nr:hypothetical protein GCM10011600_28750 [Pseudolysinimonas yzui]